MRIATLLLLVGCPLESGKDTADSRVPDVETADSATDTGGGEDTDTGGGVDTDTGAEVDTDTAVVDSDTAVVDTDTGGEVDTDPCETQAWFEDGDGDGFGAAATRVDACSAPPGFVADDTDCDDAASDVYPGAAEVCGDGVDTDCDGADLPCAVGVYTEVDADLVIFGPTGEAELGISVDGVGDLDGDGLDDVVLGAVLDATSGRSAGGAYVIPGPIDSATVLGDGWRLYGSAHDYAGANVKGAGDVNGDGFGDLLVGAYGNTPAYVALLYGPVSGDMDLHAADVVLWHDGADSYFGAFGVAGGGDVDGDGLDDLALGAPQGQPGTCTGVGSAFVVRGAGTTGVVDEEAWATVTGAPDDCTGGALSVAADLDGDGRSDLVAGVGMDNTAGAGAGAAYIYTDLVEGTQGLADASVVLTGEVAGDGAGSRVDAGGDVDGDGYADLVIGAWLSSANGAQSGAAYVVRGPPASGSLSGADAILVGGAAGGYAGWSVANDGGDFNGDGYADVLVGAALGSSDRTGLVSLQLGPMSGTLDLTAAEATFDPTTYGSSFGSAVSTAGDVTGDGLADVLIGAQMGTAARDSEGAAYVFAGRSF